MTTTIEGLVSDVMHRRSLVVASIPMGVVSIGPSGFVVESGVVADDSTYCAMVAIRAAMASVEIEVSLCGKSVAAWYGSGNEIMIPVPPVALNAGEPLRLTISSSQEITTEMVRALFMRKV